MVKKSKEYLNTFNPWTTEKEKVSKHYEFFIKNRNSSNKLFYDDLDIYSKASLKRRNLAKERVISIHGGKCAICGHGKRNHLEIHHIIPKSEGGTNDIGNLIPLCHTCHCMIHKLDELKYSPYGMSMLKRVVSRVGEIA